MWDGFANLFRNLTALTLCVTLIDWMMPSGNMRKYARLVCGLVMMMALLRPISALFMGGDATDRMASSIMDAIMGSGS